MELGLPWALLALPLPLLVWGLASRAPETPGAALRVPFYGALARARADARGSWSRPGLWLQIAAWVLLVGAAAQPRWIGEPRAVPTQGRDLMLALDLSGSMETPDFELAGRAVDRLSAVRAVAREFVRARVGDRVGLVLFGTRAYLQAPLTLDRDTVIEFLDESELGLAGEETAIGDAIGLAVKHLQGRPSEERVLVLLSDGASNAGAIDPVQAARLAAEQGIRIYTIGVGGGRAAFPAGLLGLGASAALDEQTLQQIAHSTGGRYFRASDTAELAAVYREIDALEPTEGDAALVRPMRAVFQWPLGLALALVGALLLRRLVAERRVWLPEPTSRVGASESRA